MLTLFFFQFHESTQIGSIGDEFSAFVKNHVTNQQQQKKL